MAAGQLKGPKLITIAVVFIGWVLKWIGRNQWWNAAQPSDNVVPTNYNGQNTLWHATQPITDHGVPMIRLTYFDARGRGEAIRCVWRTTVG